MQYSTDNLMGLVLILLISLCIFHFEKNNKTGYLEVSEDFGNYISPCNKLPQAVKSALNKNDINEGDQADWEYFLPCAYTHCEKNVITFENFADGKKLFMLDGCDWIASKVAIWSLIKNEYGHNADKIMPETFVLSDRLDNERFKKFYYHKKDINSKHKFILKNFKQRQTGLKLVNNLKQINEGIRDNFKIVQDYVENPYTISGHKINLRYYLLITCYNGDIRGFIFDDGFVYYTPKKFEKFSMDKDKCITTGYIDRKIYDENPLTVKDFITRIGHGNEIKWNKEIVLKFSLIMKALANKVCTNRKLDQHFKFQVFGADIAPDENLKCTLMEINKGPDLGYKDGRDGELKKQMVEDLFKIAEKDGDNNNTRFIRVY